MNKHIEEIMREYKGKITDHVFDGSCGYNNNEGGRGHLECRYPYNPGRENPSGLQCLKLKEEHFDIEAAILTYAAKEREELREKVEKLIKKLPEREFVDERAEKGAYNSAILRVLSLLTPEPPTSPKEK